jgi:hypothetical protein
MEIILLDISRKITLFSQNLRCQFGLPSGLKKKKKHLVFLVTIGLVLLQGQGMINVMRSTNIVFMDMCVNRSPSRSTTTTSV